MSQRYRVLDGPETDAATVQQLWLAVHDSCEITVELVCTSRPMHAQRVRKIVAPPVLVFCMTTTSLLDNARKSQTLSHEPGMSVNR